MPRVKKKPQPKVKPMWAWFVVGPSGEVFYGAGYEKRRDAICEMNGRDDWHSMRRTVYTVRRLRIGEET